MIQKGFNIIELMITMAIISIVASVALPSYNHYVTKSKLTNLVSEAKSLETTLSMYLMDYGTFGAHYRGHSSIHMDKLNHNLTEVVTTLNNDNYFKVKNLWSGQCKRPGLTAHVITTTGNPITGGASSEFYVRYDLTGKFIGISPAPWGRGRTATKKPWWPQNFYGSTKLEEKVSYENGSWYERCITP
jgi:prepilin-type N-terminal cleavage/methylation domain-containing protein